MTYSLTHGQVIELKKFVDGRVAARAYVEAEKHNGRNEDCEIVLVGADSLEALKTTHGHYFDDAEAPVSPYLAGV